MAEENKIFEERDEEEVEINEGDDDTSEEILVDEGSQNEETSSKRRRKSHLTYTERKLQEENLATRAALEEERSHRRKTEEKNRSLERQLMQQEAESLEQSELFIEDEIDRIKRDIIEAKVREDPIKEMELQEKLLDYKLFGSKIGQTKKDVSTAVVASQRVPDDYYSSEPSYDPLFQQWAKANPWLANPQLAEQASAVKQNLENYLVASEQAALINTPEFYQEITNQVMGQNNKNIKSKVSYSSDDDVSVDGDRFSVALTAEEKQNFKDIFRNEMINGRFLNEKEIMEKGKQIKLARMKAEGKL